MDLVYSGEHSITFYDVPVNDAISTEQRNTWTDFHLIPVERPFVSYSSPNIRMIAIPGTSKRLDITDYHIGGLTYGPRTGTWEFYIDHDQYDNWKAAYDTICGFVHGKELYIALSDEPLVFYKGVLTVSNYTAGPNYSRIAIQYDLDHDITIGLLSICPLKFIGENGISYANDYGLTVGSEYMVDFSDGGKGVNVYDLIVLQNGGG